MPRAQQESEASQTSMLARAIRAQRVNQDLTQADLADTFGVKPQTVGKWESSVAPQRRFHEQLADFLGLSDARAVRDLATATAANVIPFAKPGFAPGSGIEPDPVQSVIKTIDTYISMVDSRLRPDETALLTRMLDQAVATTPKTKRNH